VAKKKAKPIPPAVEELMVEKSFTLSKAQALAAMGMGEVAGPLWASAAAQEERLAPLLEALGHDLEAAVHRISAGSCFQKAKELSRAANLYRAALAGPLREETRRDVETMLKGCLEALLRESLGTIRARKNGKVATGT
jgi:hypothetical protein